MAAREHNYHRSLGVSTVVKRSGQYMVDAVKKQKENDFVYDATFSIEDYLTRRLAKNFAKAEDRHFGQLPA